MVPPDPSGPELTVSAVTASPGESVTVTLTGAPGGVVDWLALATVGDPNYSYWNYTYVGAGSTSWTWTVAVPAAPGAYEFRFFLNNDYQLEATSPTVLVQ